MAVAPVGDVWRNADCSVQRFLWLWTKMLSRLGTVIIIIRQLLSRVSLCSRQTGVAKNISFYGVFRMSLTSSNGSILAFIWQLFFFSNSCVVQIFIRYTELTLSMDHCLLYSVYLKASVKPLIPDEKEGYYQVITKLLF